MGDTQKNDIKTEQLETKIAVEEPYWLPQQQEQQPQQRHYYEDPTYGQRQTPAYQQRVGGQNVYVSGGYPPEPANASRAPMYRANDPEQPEEDYQRHMPEIFTDAFSTIKIRNRFVQRVYTILAIQLFISLGFLLLVTFEENMRLLLLRNYLTFFIVGMVLYFAVYLALACSVNLRRTFPINFILLGGFTVGLTLIVSLIVARVSPVVALAAVGTTAVVCLLVSLFACQTKWDVTGCGACLCIAMIVMMIYGLILMVLMLLKIYIPILHVIYSALGCLLFVFWLMYDTQMLVGGRRIELSPEEYIFGALTLYVDIMMILTYLLYLYDECLR